MSKDYRSSYVRANGIKTHYIEAGDGEPLILIHGGGPGASGEHNWRNNVPALARHFRVYAVDLMGCGYSAKPAVEYSIQNDVWHVAAFVDTLCLDRIRIAGNSRGALVAVKYALDFPERVRKVLMISTASVARAMGIEVGLSEGMKALARARDNLSPETMRAFLETLVYDKSRITEELVESRVRVAALPGALEANRAGSAFQEKLAKDPNLQQVADIRHRLPRVTFPLCLIWGREDRFAPVELAYQLKELLPNLTEFHVLEHSGHQCQNDHVERFNEIATAFFL